MALSFSLSSPAAYPQESTSTISGTELSRLIEISTRLGTLNETLRTELSDSLRNSEELARTLESSRTEIEALRNELASLRNDLASSRETSMALVESAAISEKESLELRTSLERAQDSLKSLETSWAAYKVGAEGRIQSLELARFRSRIVVATIAAVAIAGWTCFFVAP